MYEFIVRYKKEHIRTLTKVQVNQYHWKMIAAMLGVGLLLIVISIVSQINGKWSVVLMAFGCWLCISITYPAQYLARQISKGTGNGEKEFRYRFSDSGVEIRCGQDRNTISYKKIQKIVDAGDSLCFFLTRNAGFLVSKSDFKSEDSYTAFRNYLERQTGKAVERDVPVLLRLLCFRIQKKKQEGKI